MVRDPKKWSQLLCTAWCTYQHWSPGPKLPWKRLYHQLQIGLGHLAANNSTHTNIWEKYRKVASRGCSLQPTCWYFNLFFPTSPCGVLVFGAASPASPSPPPSPPSVVHPSAHHIAIIHITITQTSRHPPYHASSHQHCHQDIIAPWLKPVRALPLWAADLLHTPYHQHTHTLDKNGSL